MAISDIFKYQSAYNTNGTFDDKTDWQDAFNIANNFNSVANNYVTLQDNQRKYQEQIDTQPWRLAFTNAQNQANTAKEQFDLTKWQGASQGLDFLQKNGVDEQGRVRTQEELLNLARQNPQMNPYLYNQLLSGYQNWTGNMAKETAVFDPYAASQYNVMGGNSPYIYNQDGTITNFQTGQTVGKLDNTLIDPITFVSGNGYQNYMDKQKAQQQAQNAADLAQARAEAAIYRDQQRRDYEYQLRSQQQQEKQAYEQGKSTLDNVQRDLSKIMSLDGVVTDNADGTAKIINQTLFNQQISNLASLYQSDPQALQKIRDYANATAKQNGWQFGKK